MQNHYKTLGVTNAASIAEIRRAYRVLARRYHPDVNPGGDGGELFKEIALAYSILSDPEKKLQYDVELKQSSESFSETFDRAHEALRRNQRAAAYAREQKATEEAHNRVKPKPTTGTSRPHKTIKKPVSKPSTASVLSKSSRTKTALDSLVRTPQRAAQALRQAALLVRNSVKRETLPTLGQLAVIELSISIEDAIRGTRRAVEIGDSATGTRKVSVTIPPGVRTGSVIRLRSKERPNEEVVLLIKVEQHPWLSLAERGLTMEIPLTVPEAIEGTKIQVPSLGDPLLVTVEPLTQSGREVRLKNQGIVNRDGTRGDLYIRFIVKIPSQPLPDEIRSLSELLAEVYTTPVREHLPIKILEEVQK